MTFATMLSASAALGTPSLAATSVREMREYAAPMRANPARSTFCRKRTTRLLVRSFAHQGLPSSATFLRISDAPVSATPAVPSRLLPSSGHSRLENQTKALKGEAAHQYRAISLACTKIRVLGCDSVHGKTSM